MIKLNNYKITKKEIEELHCSSLHYICKTLCNQKPKQVRLWWVMKTQDEKTKIK